MCCLFCASTQQCQEGTDLGFTASWTVSLDVITSATWLRNEKKKFKKKINVLVYKNRRHRTRGEKEKCLKLQVN